MPLFYAVSVVHIFNIHILIFYWFNKYIVVQKYIEKEKKPEEMLVAKQNNCSAIIKVTVSYFSVRNYCSYTMVA